MVVFPRVEINYEDDECRGTTSLAIPVLLERPLVQAMTGPPVRFY